MLKIWAARGVQRFSATNFSPGCDPGDLGSSPGDPGSSPPSGSLHGACFSLCLCLSWINKLLKKRKRYNSKSASCTKNNKFYIILLHDFFCKIVKAKFSVYVRRISGFDSCCVSQCLGYRGSPMAKCVRNYPLWFKDNYWNGLFWEIFQCSLNNAVLPTTRNSWL